LVKNAAKKANEDLELEENVDFSPCPASLDALFCEVVK